MCLGKTKKKPSKDFDVSMLIQAEVHLFYFIYRHNNFHSCPWLLPGPKYDLGLFPLHNKKQELAKMGVNRNWGEIRFELLF